MGRLERGLRAISGKPLRNSAGDPVQLTLDDPAGWPSTLGGIGGSATETGAMKISAVNRCQELLSQSIGKLPIYCINQSTYDRVSHELLYLLNVRPNEAMTPSVEKQMVEGNRLSGGNGYEWIVRDPRTGRPRELIPLPWELVTPWRDRNGVIWYGVINPVSGEPLVIANQDMIHVKAYSHDGLTGISVLKRASEVVAAGRAAQQYELSYFTNGGTPSGVLETDSDVSGVKEITKDDGSKIQVPYKQLMREEWERVHTGPGNAFRIAILDRGLKYKPLAMSFAEAQFVESKEVTVADIARFYGIPLSKLFAGKQAYNSNEQNSGLRGGHAASDHHPVR